MAGRRSRLGSLTPTHAAATLPHSDTDTVPSLAFPLHPPVRPAQRLTHSDAAPPPSTRGSVLKFWVLGSWSHSSSSQRRSFCSTGLNCVSRVHTESSDMLFIVTKMLLDFSKIVDVFWYHNMLLVKIMLHVCCRKDQIVFSAQMFQYVTESEE